MTEKKEYKIRINGTQVTVSREVYTVYYRTERHAAALKEKDARHGTTSYHALDTDERLGEELLRDPKASVEEQAIANLLREKLRRSIALLSKPEQELIRALYFEELTERQLSCRVGIPQQTINYKRRRILQKLKKLMKI
ncbi:MAG: sigma-70 family RNA polymerase sigma factor [Oscillospiraceae bacterium]|jgi:RNA polymerase sigma factor (sigma-70 family)|nr:sigma-70 family RNA polymerase sigma factor [Oscillospiraceae bacterium]